VWILAAATAARRNWRNRSEAWAQVSALELSSVTVYAPAGSDMLPIRSSCSTSKVAGQTAEEPP
jgi:hypothetical protein